MIRRKQVAAVDQLRPDREVRDESRAGLVVRLSGERGTFSVAYEALTDRGSEYVCLWAIDRKQWRTVHPDKVRWTKPKRARKQCSD